MLYLDLAGVYLPFSLHSQTSLLYRTSNAAESTLYGSTTLFGAIVQDDLSINPTTSGRSHTTHGCTAHKQAASSTVSSNFTRRY